MQTETKNCQSCKQDFNIEPEDFVFYTKIDVPVPEKCPGCRQDERLMFRNFKTLYNRPSSKSGKSMISMYSPSVPFPVWTIDEWWADDWDPKGFGRDFDFSRPFFEQYNELLNTVPHYGIWNVKSNNCQYANVAIGSNNCYMVFGCVNNEKCDYGHIVWNSNDSVDNLYLYKCELCYECIDCLYCNKLFYSAECEACVDSIGLYDCHGCTNCIGCVGLRQKSFCIFNEQVSKEDYEKFLQEHPLSRPENIKFILDAKEKLRQSLPQRAFYGYHNTDVSGNHIYNAHNLHYCFDVKGGEDSKFGFTSSALKDSYDVTFAPGTEDCYMFMGSTGSKNRFCINCSEGVSCVYSQDCAASENIFGCAGLKSGKYCILNKQYSPEAFDELRLKIIEHMKSTGEWGQWFPVSMSPFAYNESVVSEYSPMSKEAAVAKGYRWKDDIPATRGKETISHDQLPTDPAEYNTEDLLKQILKCSNCERNYRLIPREIAFYSAQGLSIPRECFNCRHGRRMNSRLPRTLFDATCAKCKQRIQTSYPPELQNKYKIYCESCYQQEVV